MADAAAITAAVSDLVVRARAFTITDADTYRAVVAFLDGIKALRGTIADTFDEHIKRAYDAHRALCQEKRAAEAAAVEAEGLAKALLVAYDDARQAADERERLRLTALARAAATDDVLDRAVTAAEAGDGDAADAILDAGPLVPTAAVPPSTPKVEGLSFRQTWAAEVVDFGTLVRAAAVNPQYVALLKPDLPALNGLARALRQRMAVPGVRAVASKGVASRR